ncbi:MAG: extracellular solute-binding protein [Firmicutes bacterium]|nr:extracellular solute-binding protein [Bacillota bacterium]
MRRTLMVVRMVAVFILLVLLSGCVGAGVNKGAVKSDAKQISAMVLDRGLITTDEGSYEKNRWTQLINEESGVEVKWVPVPSAAAQLREKLNVLIASNSAPDVITSFDRLFIARLANEGVIMPIEELMNKHSNEYKKYLEQNPQLMPELIFDDGQMYAIGSKRGAELVANHAMFIRRDWLDKLSLTAPTTDEELIKTAKAFKEMDPDGNGKDDTYGIAFQFLFPVAEAMYQGNTLWYANGNKLEYGPVSERYLDVLTFLKRIYDEGLIDPEFFTDPNSVKIKQAWNKGKAGIYFAQFNSSGYREVMQNEPSAVIEPLEPVATKYGRNGLWQEVSPRMYVTLNKGTKEPEAAMKFFDWMISDGWHKLQFGIEGTHYNMVDGIPKTINKEKNNKEVMYAISYMFLTQGNITSDYYEMMAEEDSISQAEAKLTGKSQDAAVKYPFRRDIPFDPPLPEVSELWAEFKPVLEEIRVKMMVSGADYTPEMALNNLRNEWNRLGGGEVERAVNEWYLKNK